MLFGPFASRPAKKRVLTEEELEVLHAVRNRRREDKKKEKRRRNMTRTSRRANR